MYRPLIYQKTLVEKFCRSSAITIIVYYVPRQSKKFLYEDAEFNVQAESEDGKTASEYKQFDCLGRYDTLYEIGMRNREFDVAERGETSHGGESSDGKCGGRAHPRFASNFSAAPHAGKEHFLCLFQIKYSFTRNKLQISHIY